MSYAIHCFQLSGVHFKPLLDAAALVLAIVNGLFLLKFYLRDRPKLEVRAVRSDFYQWWFKMPARQHDGETTRNYGFVAYIEVLNTGLRKTELDSTRLYLPTAGQGRHRLEPHNMPEPKATIGKLEKYYPVLGQKGIHSDGSTLTEPGCSITGMVFFEYECYGGGSWDPIIQNGKIAATFAAKSIFGKNCRCVIEFSEKSFDEMTAMAPGIELTSKS